MTNQCLHCFKPIRITKNRHKNLPKSYCSFVCFGSSHGEPTSTIECKHCGKPFQVNAWEFKQRAVQFCNPSCRNKARARPVADRFWEKVRKAGADECWLWTGATVRGGYGVLGSTTDRKTAHRVSYELKNGPIQDNDWVLHKCDVPACVNPDHLFLGDAADNNQDKAQKGRAAVKLTAAEVILIREAAERGLMLKAIALSFGVSAALIGKIVSRKLWKHL